jgi:RHS repeat-associated protein
VNSVTTNFVYRGDGLRDSRAVSGGATTTFTWDIASGLPVVLDDGNQYVYGAGLTSMKQGGNWYYYLADGLGSTMAVVDSSGNSQKSYTYDVYGEVTGGSGALANEFDFAGQQTDGTGLQYLRARYYDPETGTFLSREPLATAESWTGNHYSYGGGSPAALDDPTGQYPDDGGGGSSCSDGVCNVSNIPGLPAPPEPEDGETFQSVQHFRDPWNGDDLYRLCSGISGPCGPWLTADQWLPIALNVGRYIAARASTLVGEYVRIGGKKVTISPHAAVRMAERGVSRGELQRTIDTAGKEIRYRDAKTGLCTSGYFSKATGVFVAIRNGEIATVIRPTRGQGYADGLAKC